ncbi:hypothetical protein D3C73_1226660 [compost metagenome]
MCFAVRQDGKQAQGPIGSRSGRWRRDQFLQETFSHRQFSQTHSTEQLSVSILDRQCSDIVLEKQLPRLFDVGIDFGHNDVARHDVRTFDPVIGASDSLVLHTAKQYSKVSSVDVECLVQRLKGGVNILVTKPHSLGWWKVCSQMSVHRRRGDMRIVMPG